MYEFMRLRGRLRKFCFCVVEPNACVCLFDGLDISENFCTLIYFFSFYFVFFSSVVRKRPQIVMLSGRPKSSEHACPCCSLTVCACFVSVIFALEMLLATSFEQHLFFLSAYVRRVICSCVGWSEAKAVSVTIFVFPITMVV